MSVVRAREPFAFTDHSGLPRVVRTGDLFAADDPDVVLRPNLFETVETTVSRNEDATSPGTPPGVAPIVEQTTAAPGERRSVIPTTAKGGNGRGGRGGGTTTP